MGEAADVKRRKIGVVQGRGLTTGRDARPGARVVPTSSTIGSLLKSLLVTILLASLALNAAGAGPASAATGDFVGSVTFSQDCVHTPSSGVGDSGIGVGITYDGTSLWYSCAFSGATPDLLRADPTTGVVNAHYDIDGGLGALAYDATRNAIWAGPAGGSNGAITLISLDASKNVTSSTPEFFGVAPTGVDDGIAYDGTDDSLYFSPDTSTTITHYTSAGVVLGISNWAGSGCYNSGLGLGGSLLYQGSDGCSHVWVTNKTSPQGPVAFDFSTLVAGDPNFRDEGLTCDPNTFASLGKQVMWSKEAYSPMRAHAYEIPAGSCGFGGLPAGTSGFLTGGGGVASGGVSAKFGTELYCDTTTTPDNLEINWGQGNKFHLTGLSRASCTNDTSFSPGQPAAGFDTYTGSGTGKYNGVAGATATWTFTDHGEPGSSDTAQLTVKNPGGTTVLNVSGTLSQGNIQAHPAG